MIKTQCSFRDRVDIDIGARRVPAARGDAVNRESLGQTEQFR